MEIGRVDAGILHGYIYTAADEGRILGSEYMWRTEAAPDKETEALSKFC